MSKKDEYSVFGNRIPREYFVAMGCGQIDRGSGKDPWETGSYDLALLDAGIENFNIVEYTSVLPPESRKVDIDDIGHPFHHGAVLETIMASVNGHIGERLCAGVGTIQVRRKSDGKHIGGFAAEYEGYADEKTANTILKGSLRGIVERRNKSLGDGDQLIPFDEKTYVKDFFVEENYGTVLVAICFVNYIYPLLEEA